MRTLSLSAVVLATLLPSPAVAKLNVVTTLPDFAALATELGGDRVEAHALLKGTQDPHFADAKPSMILEVNRAELLVIIGLDLEAGWLPVLMTQARNDAIQIGAPGYLDASQFIVAKEVPTKLDRAMGDVHAGGNPHYYTSPDQLFLVAQAIHKKLLELDAEGRATYDERWAAFEKQYRAKTAVWQKRLAPYRGTQVVVYHQSWIYLLDWMDFVRAGALEPKPGISPSPSHVSQLLARVKAHDVQLVFQEIYHPTNLSRLFAQKAGAKLLILPSMVGAQPGIETIWQKFDRIVDLVLQGMST
jgi:zinc/manganese transport system substrate-binding protein